MNLNPGSIFGNTFHVVLFLDCSYGLYEPLPVNPTFHLSQVINNITHVSCHYLRTNFCYGRNWKWIFIYSFFHKFSFEMYILFFSKSNSFYYENIFTQQNKIYKCQKSEFIKNCRSATNTCHFIFVLQFTTLPQLTREFKYLLFQKLLNTQYIFWVYSITMTI